MPESIPTKTDNRDAIKYIVSKLRAITLAVQIIPFAYTFIYIITLILYLFASEEVLTILDTLLYVSPIIIICMIVESKVLKLCRWHKTACTLPAIPQINILIDRYIYEFSIRAEIIHLSIILLMSILLLVASYNVFLK